MIGKGGKLKETLHGRWIRTIGSCWESYINLHTANRKWDDMRAFAPKLTQSYQHKSKVSWYHLA